MRGWVRGGVYCRVSNYWRLGKTDRSGKRLNGIKGILYLFSYFGILVFQIKLCTSSFLLTIKKLSLEWSNISPVFLWVKILLGIISLD